MIHKNYVILTVTAIAVFTTFVVYRAISINDVPCEVRATSQRPSMNIHDINEGLSIAAITPLTERQFVLMSLPDIQNISERIFAYKIAKTGVSLQVAAYGPGRSDVGIAAARNNIQLAISQATRNTVNSITNRYRDDSEIYAVTKQMPEWLAHREANKILLGRHAHLLSEVDRAGKREMLTHCS